MQQNLNIASANGPLFIPSVYSKDLSYLKTVWSISMPIYKSIIRLVTATSAVCLTAIFVGVLLTGFVEPNMVSMAAIIGAIPASAASLLFLGYCSFIGRPSPWLGGLIGFLAGASWLLLMTEEIGFSFAFGAIAGLAGLTAAYVGVKILDSFDAGQTGVAQ